MQREAEHEEGAETGNARGESRADGEALAEVMQADAEGDVSGERHAGWRSMASPHCIEQQERPKRDEDDHRYALEGGGRLDAEFDRFLQRIHEQVDEQAHCQGEYK